MGQEALVRTREDHLAILPKGYYVVHHALFFLVGLIGVLGTLFPRLAPYQGAGLILSVGIMISGVLGVYARMANDAEMEVVALRMMAIMALVWGVAAMMLVTFSTGGVYTLLGGLGVLAQGAILWAIAKGVSHGIEQDTEDLLDFIVVMLSFSQTEADDVDEADGEVAQGGEEGDTGA